MIAIPAIDLREGACVQLVGGDYAAERIRLGDPAAVASRWVDAGFTRLHVVDLDAATSRGSNRDVIAGLLEAATVPVQVGGGLRTDEAVADMIYLGADRVVLGTRAVREPEWLVRMAETWPGRIVLAADVRDGLVTTDGWQRTTTQDVVALLAGMEDIPVAAALVTAVEKEGRLGGPDLALMQRLARASRFPLLASGGITSLDDLRTLAAGGVAGAILGMALYTGTLDPRAVAEEFGT